MLMLSLLKVSYSTLGLYFKTTSLRNEMKGFHVTALKAGLASVWFLLKVSCPHADTWTEAAATFACWPRTGGSIALAVESVCF